MNVFLLAAQEDDVEAISKNFCDIKVTDRSRLLTIALKNHSVQVVEFFLQTDVMKGPFMMLLEMELFEALGRTRGCEKKEQCFQSLRQYTNYSSNLLSGYIMWCIRGDDTKGALQALQSCDFIYNLKLYDAARMGNRAVFFAILPKVCEEENFKSEFVYCIRAYLFDFAFHILEFCNGNAQDWCEFAGKTRPEVINFLKYREIYKRSRVKAANKIYFWWIPICYNKFGRNMAEKGYTEFLAMYNSS